jgi:hypothetical protein
VGGGSVSGEGVVAVPLADAGLLHRTEVVWSGRQTKVVERFVSELAESRSNQL